MLCTQKLLKMVSGHSMLFLRVILVWPVVAGQMNQNFTLIRGNSNRGSTADCGKPPDVQYANLTFTNTTEGSVATYSCSTGTQLRGQASIVCRLSGSWEVAPYCFILYCPPPPRIAQGSYHSAAGRYVYQTVVSYACYMGYEIEGTSTDVVCQENMTWSYPLPICKKKDCGIPPSVSNGNVTYNQTVYLSEATYQCQPGYKLTSMESSSLVTEQRFLAIRCKSDGTWHRPPECQPQSCSTPPVVAHSTRRSMSFTQHYYTDRVIYECEYGYRIANDNGDNTITCQADGKWSIPPECTRVTCPSPPALPNAKISDIGSLSYGNKTSYTCDTGYEMSGLGLIVCMADGQWSPLSYCQKVNCRTPPAIHNGQHEWNDTHFGASARYSCDPGYRLKGVKQITCLNSGAWSDIPVCDLVIEVNCRSPPLIPNGKREWNSTSLKAVAHYSCDEGFKLHGINPVECLGDGKWSDVPVCDFMYAVDRPSPAALSSSNLSLGPLTGLTIACILFGVVTLVSLVYTVLKTGTCRRSRGFTYTAYKNGEERVQI